MANRKNAYEAKRTLPLTNRELEVVFDVTAMTLHLWKQGTPTKTRLPTLKTKGRTVRYGVQVTLDWARKNEVPIAVHPDDLASREGVAAAHQTALKKPGPKPRAAASALAPLPSERPTAGT